MMTLPLLHELGAIAKSFLPLSDACVRAQSAQKLESRFAVNIL